MKAVIMAGGEGTRLRPLTCNRPKPMVPIANKPVMEHIIELLKKYNLKDIAVTLQYMPEMIKEYFGNGDDFGVNIQYYVEKTPLGTAGSVKNAERFLDETFVVISGDALTDIDLQKAINFHFEKGAIATLVLKKVDIPLEYGVVVINEEERISRFLEKPSWGEVFSDTVNTGIYILSPEVLKYFKPNEKFDFSKDLFPILLKENKPLYGYVADEYWCDIGDLKAYLQAHIDVMNEKVSVNIPGKLVTSGIWVGEGTVIDEEAVVSAPCIIGRDCRIRRGSVIGSYSVLGDCTSIGERNGIKRSVIWKGAILDENVQLRGSILCNRVHIKENLSAFENSVIGDSTIIKENVLIKPNIKIWPDKLIEAGVEVNTNMIWGSRYLRTIFGNRGVTGEINVDITPEYASKMGAAYASIFKKKPRIAISCDDSTPAGMIKLSFMCGLLSAGVEIYDFGMMLLPVTRSALRFYGVDGGIHISTCTDVNTRLFIDFLDKNGSSIDRNLERKIENAFTREDFNRCEGDCIQNVIHVPEYSKYYLRGIINSIKSEKITYKIALNSRSGFIASTVSELLEELGCKVVHTDLKLINTKSIYKSNAAHDIRFFTSHVKMNNFDFGVSIEDTSEKMMLVDNKGRIITEDMFIALISIILFRTIRGGTMVVPISASHVIEKIAGQNNGKVIRTKTSSQEVMGEILSSEVKEGMLDQFTLHFDAIAGLAKILDFMHMNDYKLSDLVEMIPDFYINRKEVECSWDAKGKVIRQIIQEDNQKIETLEGVKIFNDNGWVLVLPDAEKPICRIISESHSAEFAEELSNIYINKIREISRG